MDGMDDESGLAVVRPTRWKTSEFHENADPRVMGKHSHSLVSPNHDRSDSSDDDEVNMADTSREMDERDIHVDDAAFDQLITMTEGAMQSVRLKASPGKADLEEEAFESEDPTEDDDDDGYDESYGSDAAEHETNGTSSQSHEDGHSQISESSSFDFDVDKSREGVPLTSPRNEWASPAKADQKAPPPKPNGSRPVSAIRKSNVDPTAYAAKEWLAECVVLNTKQRVIEQTMGPVGNAVVGNAKDTGVADANVRKSHDGDIEAGFVQMRRDRETLRTDLAERLQRVRGGVKRLASHVTEVKCGEAYVVELGRLMDNAERDVVALKEAQRLAYDRLVREERDLTRHVDDFTSRVETWDADTSDPVWVGVSDDGLKKKQNTGRRAYGAPTPPDKKKVGKTKAQPWSRGSVTTAAGRPSPARPVDEAPSCVSGTEHARESVGNDKERPGPWARQSAATARSPGQRSADADSPGAAGGLEQQKKRDTKLTRSPPPPAVVEYDEFLLEYGATGGWADVDHARWRRCLARCNMHYAHATTMAAEDLLAFGIDRGEVVRHARWDAERENLFEQKKTAVRAWRAAQTRAAKDTRDALDAEIARAEQETREKASAKALAAREKENAALREWKANKTEDDARVREATAHAKHHAVAEEAERRKQLTRERAERDKRNALRALEREELRDASRAAAEAAAEALIPSAPKMTKEEARGERDRLAGCAMETAQRRREASTAKHGELLRRVERQKVLAVKARNRRRLAEGRTENSLNDPDRLTRATAASAFRAASEREVGGLFNATPAVQYLSHKATPSWRATR